MFLGSQVISRACFGNWTEVGNFTWKLKSFEYTSPNLFIDTYRMCLIVTNIQFTLECLWKANLFVFWNKHLSTRSVAATLRSEIFHLSNGLIHRWKQNPNCNYLEKVTCLNFIPKAIWICIHNYHYFRMAILVITLMQKNS